MNKQYRTLALLTFTVGVIYALGQGVSGPLSLLFGTPEVIIKELTVGVLFFLLTLISAKVIKIEIIHGYIEKTLKVKVPSLIGDISSGTVIFIGSCLILSLVFKQNISALIVTGAGSAAILGFALKDFAVALASGITFNFEDTLKVGDRIKVTCDKSSYEGFVQKITWRNTVLLTDHLQTVFIPNIEMSSAVILNYDLPTRAVKRLLQLEIGYDVSIESVERVLYAGALNAIGVKHASPPSVRATELRESGVNYVITYTITDIRDRLPAEHALIKSILESLRVANITIARSLDFDQTIKIANRSLDVYHLIQQVKLFRGLEQAILEDIVKELTPARFSPSTCVLSAGERDDTLFLVAEGIFSRTFVGTDGNLQTQQFVATEFFGAEALFSGIAHESTIISDTDALLYKLSKAAFKSLITKHPELTPVLAENLARIDVGQAKSKEPMQKEKLDYKKSLYQGIIESNYVDL